MNDRSPTGMDSPRHLADMVTKIRPVLAVRLAEIRKAGVSNQNLSEYAAAIGLQQMSALAKAVSILEQDDTLDPETSTPATALGRIAIEGLIYMNYLVDDDVDFRAWSFVCSEIMWREAFEDEGEGRIWRRAHGKCGAGMRHRVSEIRLPVKDHEAKWCDEYERASIQRDLSMLRRVAGFDLPPPTKATSIADWRAFWNGLGLTGPAFTRWQTMNGRWNSHRRWPFGLNPLAACTEGHLEDRLRAIAEHERPPEPVQVQRPTPMIEWVGRMGLDIFSLLAHFSPARVAINPDAFRDSSATTHVMALWVVVRLLASRFHWAQTLQSSI